MEISTILLGLAGGLGLFLYGMDLMGEGLQRVAGTKLRSVLAFFTKNTLMGVIVGTIFTAIIQSSSATTVMVVSFVNAGLITLAQSFGVILGANIGTTMTAQIVSLDISAIAPIFLLLGVVLHMAGKKPVMKHLGSVAIGFGALFLGMDMMSAAMSSVKESEAVLRVMGSLSNPFLAILVSVALTAIVQSSSVSVAIVLLLTQQGLLTLDIAFYAILGCNIGTCATALLACISCNKDARRAAMIHLLFNVIGSAINMVVLLAAIDPIREFILDFSGGNVGRAVANAQSIFRIAQVLILLPFSKQLIQLTQFIIRGEDAKLAPQELKYIDQNHVDSNVAVPSVMAEMTRMGEIAVANLDLALESLLEHDENKANQVFEMEKTIDYLNHEITQYLVKANQMSLPISDKNLLAALFHVVNDIERIGDHAENVAEDTVTQRNLSIRFSDAAMGEIRQVKSMVDEILTLALDMFRTGRKDHMERILALENAIDELERELQDNHITRLNNGECNAQAGAMFLDLVGNLERVSDHATNVAFALLEHDPEGEKAPKIRTGRG